jgi:hypothetical protein
MVVLVRGFAASTARATAAVQVINSGSFQNTFDFYRIKIFMDFRIIKQLSGCCPYRNGVCCGSCAHATCVPAGHSCNGKDEIDIAVN